MILRNFWSLRSLKVNRKANWQRRDLLQSKRSSADYEQKNGRRIKEMYTYSKNEAVRYDQIIHQPVYSYYVFKKLKLIHSWFSEKSVVLDVGCGTGVYTTSIAKHCKTIVGVDVSPQMIMRGLAKAKKIGLDNAHFVIGDIAHSPFQDKVYDLVFSVNALHHFSSEKAVIEGLTEKVRCCKQTGHVIVFELNPNSLGWSKNLIPVVLRGIIHLLLFPFSQKVIDNVEEGTRMVNVSELLMKTGKVKLVSIKVGGFVPTYCPKFAFKLFVLLERIMDITPLLRRYGAHVMVVGEVQ